MTETRSLDGRSKWRSRVFMAPLRTRLAQSRRAALALLLTFTLVNCRRSPNDSSNGFPRAETFYVGGLQWGEPSSFNPLHSNPDWPVSHMNLLYETLLLYNSITGKMEPLLAESYATHDDSVEVTLNPAARWNDGKPVTAWDVTYTFALGQKYKSLSIAPVWQYLSSVRAYNEDGTEAVEAKNVSASDKYPRRVVFTLNPEKKNPLVIFDALQGQHIVPRHVLEPLFQRLNGNLSEFNKLKFDQDIVSSGPYKLLSYSGEKVATVRDDNYWGNRALHQGQKPVVKYLVHLIFKSNSHYSVALQQGRLDASSAYIPRIWLKAAKGVQSWLDKEPYFLSNAVPMLFINHKHAPLDDVHMRRAMGFAINYKDVRELAVSGYSDPLRPGLILPFGIENQFFSEADAKQYGTRFDPEAAKAELQAGGYSPVFAADGGLIETRDKSGNKVPTVYVKSPIGWSDWESIVHIAVKSMRAVGIDARERFVDAPLFWNALFEGDFDLIMDTPASAPSPSAPWSRLEAVMGTRDFAPLGQRTYRNMGRFNDPSAPGYNPRIDQLLSQIPTLKDPAALLAAYRELNVLFMQLQPSLPLVYRPDAYYQFSTKHWTNMPTGSNPYLPPFIPGDHLGRNLLWSIKPVAN